MIERPERIGRATWMAMLDLWMISGYLPWINTDRLDARDAIGGAIGDEGALAAPATFRDVLRETKDGP